MVYQNHNQKQNLMAHKIDISKGKAAFVSFQMPAWHGLGKTFDRPISVAEALQESGQEFQVYKAPNIHKVPNGEQIESTRSFFTYRDDTKAVLGAHVGPDYTVYQNAEAFVLVDEMLKFGKVTIETAGAIEEGRRVFVLLKLTDPMTIGKSDKVFSYVLVCNSHDGTLAITAMVTNVRVVCWNTLSAALRNKETKQYKIRHTKNAASRVAEAMKVLELLEISRMASQIEYNAMKETRISRQEFMNYVGNIFMTDEEITELQRGNNEISTRKENIMNDVLDFSARGVGQKEATDGGMNAWWAYNGVTGFLTAKNYKTADDRFDSLLLGDSAKKIERAGQLALHMDQVRPLHKILSSNLN